MNWYISLYIPDFPAQSYAAYHPEVNGIPFVIVRQQANSHKSIVTSLSPEAQARGLYHGFPVAKLAERFRDIRIIPDEPALAAAIADDCATVLSAFSPDVRVNPRGSALVNATGMRRLLGPRFHSLAAEIRFAVKSTLAIHNCAAGAGASPYIASMAARAAAPDGITICEKGREAAMLAPVAVSTLPGLSATLRRRLGDYNIRTVADIQRLSEGFLKARFGEEGMRLHAMAHGAFLQSRPRSCLNEIETGQTLARDENDVSALKSRIRDIVDRLVFELRTVRLQAGSVAFTVRYSDDKAVQRSMKLLSPTSDFTLLYKCCCVLFDQAYTRRIAVRRLSASARPFNERECQLDLFDAGAQMKQENMGRSIGEIRMRMGFAVVRNGNIVISK
jgi:DNA polymerase IV